MKSIYNIQEELFDIFEQIEENEGELTPELEEQLNINREEFKDKIKSYSYIITKLENDLTAIKDEKARLDALKKSKEKTIDRLKYIMVKAINAFGDTSKTGVKFIDYGTGKVSIRKSESLEIDEDKLKSFTNRFMFYFQCLHFTNTFEQTELSIDEILEFSNHDNTDEFKTNFSKEDFDKLQASIDLNINLKDLISTEEGRTLIKAILNYNPSITTSPIVDKRSLKNDIKSEGILPSYANIVTKENITIK